MVHVKRRERGMRERRSHVPAKLAVVCTFIAILCCPAVRSWGEKKTWQAGTILGVKAHEQQSNSGDAARMYDISVKVGKRIYVALYTAENNEPDPGYYVGMRRTVLIDGDILKFNDLLGHTHSLRILSSKDAPPDSK